MKSEVIPSSAVGQKINEWYKYIRTFSVPDAEILKAEIEREIEHMEDDPNLLLYFSLMEFRHQLMLDYLEPLEKLKIEDQPSLSELLRNIDSNQADLKGLLDYYVNFFRGMHEFDKREFISAITYYKQAEKRLSFVADHIERAEFYFKVAEAYYYMKQTYFSLIHIKNAYEIYAEQETYNVRIIQCHFVFGVNLMDERRFEQAARHFELALHMAESENKAQLVGRALYNIGLCYYNQDLLEPAIDYFERAVSIFESNDIIKSLPQAYFLVTQIYYKCKNNSKAVEYHSRGYEYAKETDDIDYMVKFEFLKTLYQAQPDEQGIEKCFYYLKNKNMYADIEDLALVVAKYYYEQKNFEMSSSYFLKVEEARKQIQRSEGLYEIEI
ncbi:tetratricopeptide repeat protein [Bacillus atrophaeus]|uniref:Rap family tetratricopeptide repeat protein n=1 Tax=Bacillus atrophaeus TaxID=1452 RepID=UPI00227F3F7E|nr:Rap family tetratricopeptide repeat protein [Bacillus atrophaeus]MCY8486492.1 tetratricopeptide repeat protein [Bacillus atrophaeus]MCY8914780.1 tetratricopeptide repeat protein [Bacillus atrophaeus]MCY9116037.1 tetratricopeptide repeat protein [Bacillus atrophaeus]MEC0926291.1 tetratricopeptide repeat protein [Bacillus atrophaeus]MEC0935167.1 tetratricopeptide repeat protein [Bacillus atrophaeus]